MSTRGNGYRQKVDRAAQLDLKIKQLQEELKDLKEELKKIAVQKGVKILQGHDFVADFGSYTRTDLSPEILYSHLRDTHRLDEIPRYMRPNMTAVNRGLKAELAEYIKTFTDPWGRISFKPMKGGKE